VICGDTSIYYEGKMYGKPKDKEDAFNTLKTLCGHTHQCITAVWVGLLDGEQELIDSVSDVVSSNVIFKMLTDVEIWGYINTEQPMNNAGAYMLQAHGATLYEKIDGCFYGIWGLPLGALAGIMVPLLKKHKLIGEK
jgi:septum formation protein